jgi:ElaB/YqjD/DUF883 family membrane-anchored ribosome-binding protein
MKHDIERISAGLEKLLEEAEALLQSAAEGADRKLDAAENSGREALQRICGNLRTARSELQDDARKIDGVVHGHPWLTLTAGAMVGFLAGLLVRRR